MPNLAMNVGFQGVPVKRTQRGDRQTVAFDPKQTSDPWTCAEKLLTLGLRASGAELAMKRREFITLLGGGAVAWPLAAHAQLRPPLIGWLGIGDADPGAVFLAGFLKGMKKLGYVEGRDFTMALRWSSGANERLSPLTTELMVLEPTIIVAEGTRGAEVTAQATSTIPIVVISLAELTAVKLGGANFAHPAANVTGVLTSPRKRDLQAFRNIGRCDPGVSSVRPVD
jgi:putative tryptophan/tyrosine transport system substrate-binding protein